MLVRYKNFTIIVEHLKSSVLRWALLQQRSAVKIPITYRVSCRGFVDEKITRTVTRKLKLTERRKISRSNDNPSTSKSEICWDSHALTAVSHWRVLMKHVYCIGGLYRPIGYCWRHTLRLWRELGEVLDSFAMTQWMTNAKLLDQWANGNADMTKMYELDRQIIKIGSLAGITSIHCNIGYFMLVLA